MARRDSVWFSVQKSAMIAPWFLAEAIFRRIYGFQVEGIEYLPARGPFILGINEYSLIAMLISGWMSLRLVSVPMNGARIAPSRICKKSFGPLAIFERRSTWRPSVTANCPR